MKARNGIDCAVINLQGRTYMPATDCPFRKMDQILGELDPAVKVRFVDFHAEVTSEKMAWAGIWTAAFPRWSARTRISRPPTRAFCPAAPRIRPMRA